MKTYQRIIFAIVRLGFILVPILAIVITVANAFDHPLRSGEVGAAAFIFMIGIAGFFATRLIHWVVLSNRP